MPATYEPIASVTLGSAAQVEFTSIPDTFTDLVLVVQYGVAQANDPLTYRLNGDSGANYSNTVLYGTGSAAGSYRDSGITTGAAGTYYLGASTSNEHFSVIQIMSYANTSVFKTILESSGGAGKGAERGVSLYRSTSAVTSIKLGANSAFSRNLVAGTTVSLYGIKAAWHDVNLWVTAGGLLMPTTMKLIAKQTLGSSATSVTFSSIPGTMTDLVLVGTARATTNPFSEAWFFGTLGFNSDGNGTNQSGRHVVGGGASGSVDSFSSGPRYYFTSSGATANTFGSFEIYIPNYAGSTAKSVSISSNSENNASPNIVHMGAGLWTGTAAITQLVLFPRQDSFAASSSFFLYGITKA